jgi:tungstate transport system ATP-binding protein
MSQKILTAKPLLEAKNLAVIYNDHKVLEIPSLQVPPNRVLAIIGPNGSGKTTLLLCLSLLLKPAHGEIFYKGDRVPDGQSVMQMRRRFAVVFQESLLLHTSVWENVILGLRLRGFSHSEIKERGLRWLERFGIAHLAKRQARTLSGGEAQRTSLARAFALQPELLFLDEPFAALDVPTRQSLFGDMMNILQETKCTTVLVTHDRNEAQTLAHRIIILMNGKIAQEGTPRDIFSTPSNEAIAKFVGMENILEGTVVSNRDCVATLKIKEQIIEGISNCQAGDAVNVLIRPEDVTLSLDKQSSSARNVFSGKITSLIPDGPMVRVNLDCGFNLIVLITRMSAEEMNLKAGEQVYASFKATAIHIISAK